MLRNRGESSELLKILVSKLGPYEIFTVALISAIGSVATAGIKVVPITYAQLLEFLLIVLMIGFIIIGVEHLVKRLG